MQTSQETPSVPSIASVGARLLSIVYDGLLILALWTFFGAILIILGTPHTQHSEKVVTVLPKAYLYGVIFPSYFIIPWIFYAICWRKAGQTLGMQTLFLRTVTPEGHFLTFTQGILRCMAACVVPLICALCAWAVYHHPQALLISSTLGFILNYIFAWFNPKGLAIHDILSRTITLKLPPAENQNIKGFVKNLFTKK